MGSQWVQVWWWFYCSGSTYHQFLIRHWNDDGKRRPMSNQELVICGPRTIKPSSHLNPLRSHFNLCWGVGEYEGGILTRKKNWDHRFGWGAGAQGQMAPQTITFWISFGVILLYVIRKISLLRAFWYQDHPNRTTTTCDMATGRLWVNRGRPNLGRP